LMLVLLYIYIYIYIYIHTHSSNIPPVMIINRIYENQANAEMVPKFPICYYMPLV